MIKKKNYIEIGSTIYKQDKIYIYHILWTIIVFSYFLLLILDYNHLTNNLAAILLLIVSFIFILKTLNNIPAFLMASIIFYVNYSISVGEFFKKVITSCPFSEVKTPLFYGTALRTILLFLIILTYFYKSRVYSPDFNKTEVAPVRNDAIFIGLLFLLLYLFFQIKPVKQTHYSVAITPLYEYSRLIFLFSYFFTARKQLMKILIVLVAFIFILQDFYYGGRITSLQIILFLISTIFYKKITISKIVFMEITGIFLFALVGVYRMSYKLSISFVEIFKILSKSFFVFDTATYSFYASATHIAASFIVDTTTRFKSLLEFIMSVFLGSRFFKLADVTTLAKNYYINLGGGIIATHFYFWGSWILVAFSAFVLAKLLNKLNYNHSLYARIIFLSIVISAPRWYLYSPLVLIRGGVLLPSIIYLFIKIGRFILSKHPESTKNSNK